MQTDLLSLLMQTDPLCLNADRPSLPQYRQTLSVLVQTDTPFLNADRPSLY